ncbi:MAG: DnaA N-terminal domain-containing protein, partial [Patescibacteria group bacterium]
MAELSNEQLWQATLGELELHLSKANFTTWFRNTFISAYEQGKVLVAVPTAFAKEWLEKKYHTHILQALQHLTQNAITEVTYRVESMKAAPADALSPSIDSATPPAGDMPAKVSQKTGLNPKYTFTSFIVGKGNELAQAAAMTCAEKP